MAGLLGLLLALPARAVAQKHVERTLLEPEIRAIAIDARQCFALDLVAADTDAVTLEADMEGEYQSDVLVRSERLGNTLYISTAFSPAFHLPNDKLGAHKVLSVRLRVTVPEYQRVQVDANECRLTTAGIFRKLEVRLREGGCRLAHEAENTEVTTFSAPIEVTASGGRVRAESGHGSVVLDSMPGGPARYHLRSTHGNITVRRIRG